MTPDHPLVSVIIPTYNRAQVVPRAIDSVLAQQYRPVELVVIDDGSTDDTRAVIAAYPDRVGYRYQENRERSAARNAGIAATTGELIAFLDSDDEMLPGHLKGLVRALGNRPDAGIACCRAEFFDDELGEVFDVLPRRPVEGDAYLDCATGLRMQLGTVIVRRALLDRVGWWDEELVDGLEDWELWTRCLGASEVVFVPDATVRLHFDRRNRVRDPAHMDRAIRAVARTIAEHPLNRARLAPHGRRLHGAMWARVAHHHLLAGDGRTARARLRAGAWADPSVLRSAAWWSMAIKAVAGPSVIGALRRLRRVRYLKRAGGARRRRPLRAEAARHRPVT